MTQRRRDALRYASHRVTIVLVAAIAAVNGSCLLGSKTMLCETSLRCPPGWVCSADEKACINLAGCGDGIVAPENGEVCDDGNIVSGDGCSSDCRSYETCGNGVVDAVKGETCDEGDNNGAPGFNCSTSCELAACGNGLVDLNEECDPGQGDSAGCNSNLDLRNRDAHCKFARCGDSYENRAANETCDDGMESSERCNSPVFCKISVCGDNFRNAEASEACDTGVDSQACNGVSGGSAACKIPACGDGYVNPQFHPGTAGPEKCDDGNNEDCGTCLSDCIATAKIATGFLTPPLGMHINNEEEFGLSDGTTTVKFQYRKAGTAPMSVQQITLTDMDNAATVAGHTADAINGHMTLRISASVDGNTVKLTADQPGSGKLAFKDVQLNGQFMRGTTDGSGTGLCSSGAGCVSDLDCDSNSCMGQQCQ